MIIKFVCDSSVYAIECDEMCANITMKKFTKNSNIIECDVVITANSGNKYHTITSLIKINLHPSNFSSSALHDITDKIKYRFSNNLFAASNEGSLNEISLGAVLSGITCNDICDLPTENICQKSEVSTRQMNYEICEYTWKYQT